MKILPYLLLFVLLGIIAYWFVTKNYYASDEETVSKGKLLFTRNCSSCHDLEADGMGPPLGGITDVLSKNTLVEFIRNPSQAIDSQDARAVSLYARYKQVMPAFAWMKEDEINSILAFIDHETERHHLTAASAPADTAGLTGRLVAPVKPSGIKIEMEEVVQLPRIKDTSPDLGIVTLRPHPSGDGTLFVSDQNGVIYRISNKKAAIFLDVRDHIKDFQSGPGIATGVGSFDFHPDYLSNGLIYITYAETYKGQ